MVEVPAGMKAWAGGDSAPADWDGGAVLTRSGRMYAPYGGGNPRYSVCWSNDGDGIDIIAYTPRATPTGDSASGDRDSDYKLPCDVHLPVAIVIKAGCSLQTLKGAMEVEYRPRHFDGNPRAALTPPATPDPVEVQALPGREAVAAALFEHEQSDVKWADWVKHVRGITLLGREVEKYRSLADAILALAQPGSSDEVERHERISDAIHAALWKTDAEVTLLRSALKEIARLYDLTAPPTAALLKARDIAHRALSTPSHANGGEG